MKITERNPAIAAGPAHPLLAVGLGQWHLGEASPVCPLLDMEHPRGDTGGDQRRSYAASSGVPTPGVAHAGFLISCYSVTRCSLSEKGQRFSCDRSAFYTKCDAGVSHYPLRAASGSDYPLRGEMETVGQERSAVTLRCAFPLEQLRPTTHCSKRVEASVRQPLLEQANRAVKERRSMQNVSADENAKVPAN